MKKIISLFLVLFCFISTYSLAQDVRPMMKGLSAQKKWLLQQALNEKKKAHKELQAGIENIEKDKNALVQAIANLKAKKQELLSQAVTLKKNIESLKKEQTLLKGIMQRNNADIQELVGVIRIDAKELEALLKQSPYSAMYPHREKQLSSILSAKDFPSMKDIENMARLLFKQLYLTGNVMYERLKLVDREGKEVEGRVLFVGPFTQVYKRGDTVGFLLYSPVSERFFALSKPAPYLVRWHIKRYLEGKSSSLPIDISKGAAIREFLYQPGLWENILSGGPLIWPILAIGLVGIFLIIERFFYLYRRSMDASEFMEMFREYIQKGEWNKADMLCKRYSQKVIPSILIHAIRFRNAPREELENILQEEILKVIPSLERFLSTLGMLAAIAPLLGLLGTVTGMINTFHVITYYGTSDPRLMSSGISEALITTMLGLSVAIPILFFHTLISRKVDGMVAKMEECAISVVNLIQAKGE